MFLRSTEQVCAATAADGQAKGDELPGHFADAYVQVMLNWGACPDGGGCEGDFTGDGLVDEEDVALALRVLRE